MAERQIEYKVKITEDSANNFKKISDSANKTGKDIDNSIKKGSSAGTKELTSNLDKLKASLGNVGGSAGNLASKFTTLGGAAGVVVGSIVALTAAYIKLNNELIKFVDKQSTISNTLLDNARKVSLTASEYEGLAAVFELNGSNAEGMSSAIGKLQINLNKTGKESEDFRKALSYLGVNTKGKSVTKILEEITQSIGLLSDEESKSRITTEIFGKSYQEMMGVINTSKSDWDDITSRYNKFGEIADRNADELGRLEDAMLTLEKQKQRIKDAFSEGLYGISAEEKEATAAFMENQVELMQGLGKAAQFALLPINLVMNALSGRGKNKFNSKPLDDPNFDPFGFSYNTPGKDANAHIEAFKKSLTEVTSSLTKVSKSTASLTKTIESWVDSVNKQNSILNLIISTTRSPATALAKTNERNLGTLKSYNVSGGIIDYKEMIKSLLVGETPSGMAGIGMRLQALSNLYQKETETTVNEAIKLFKEGAISYEEASSIIKDSNQHIINFTEGFTRKLSEMMMEGQPGPMTWETMEPLTTAFNKTITESADISSKGTKDLTELDKYLKDVTISMNKLDEAYADMLDKKEEYNRNLQYISEFLDAFNSVSNAINTIKTNQYNERIDKINSEYDLEKARIEGSIRSNRRRALALEKLEAERKSKSDAAAKEEGKRYKGWATGMAIISAAAGIMFAWSTSEHWAVKLAHSIVIAGELAAQLSSIQSQKFAQGGVVQGASTGDNVNIRANGGEMVLTKQQQANLFAMANGGGSSTPTVVIGDTIIQGNADASTLKALNERDVENRRFFVRMFSQLQSDKLIRPILV